MTVAEVDHASQSRESRNLSSTPRIILGSGRSGTTWVLDCLAEANGLRPIFEPLHPAESNIAAAFAYEILTAEDTASELKEYFAEIACGRVHSRWIDYRAPKGLVLPRPRQFTSIESARRWFRGWRKYWKRLNKYSAATKRTDILIKCIRANLMAPWLSRRLSYRTALVVRHPCSVVESQLRLGKVWDPTPQLNRYRENQRLNKLTDRRYELLLNDKLTVVEALTLNWVIENQWPVEQSRHGGYEVFFYEDLLEERDFSWQRLCEFLGLENVPTKDLLKTPSQQSSVSSKNKPDRTFGAKWKKELSGEQLGQIQRVLDATRFGIYDVEQPGPVSRSAGP